MFFQILPGFLITMVENIDIYIYLERERERERERQHYDNTLMTILIIQVPLIIMTTLYR